MHPKALKNLPYLVHTNHELGLMLRGQKPMACFMEIPETVTDSVTRYLRMFDRHVQSGRFTKQLYTHEISGNGFPYKSIMELFYTLPGEEWRVQAKLDLYNLPGKWSAARERRLGELLGYTDWQNEVWLRGFQEQD